MTSTKKKIPIAEVVRLYDEEKMSFDQIGVALGKSSSTMRAYYLASGRTPRTRKQAVNRGLCRIPKERVEAVLWLNSHTDMSYREIADRVGYKHYTSVTRILRIAEYPLRDHNASIKIISRIRRGKPPVLYSRWR